MIAVANAGCVGLVGVQVQLEVEIRSDAHRAVAKDQITALAIYLDGNRLPVSQTEPQYCDRCACRADTAMGTRTTSSDALCTIIPLVSSDRRL